MAQWVELRLLVPETDALALEPLDDACLSVSPGGFATEGADAPPGDDPKVPEGYTRFRVYVGPDALETARVALVTALAPWPDATIEVAALPENWRDRWKAWFQPIAVSPRLWVTTPWHEVTPPAGAKVVVVDPGMAFGTGQHETTRLCLSLLDELAATGRLPDTILDVGCGSGILAIGAVLLGARRVVAIDNDPQAVISTGENVALNGVVGRVEASTIPVGDVPETFPLVIANIMSHILIALAEGLVARTAPGGDLVLSGVLGEQVADVRTVFEALGVEHVENVADGNWVRLLFTRSAA